MKTGWIDGVKDVSVYRVFGRGVVSSLKFGWSERP